MTVRLEFNKYFDLYFVRYCQIERLYIPGSATPMHQAGSSLAVAGQRGSLLAGQRPGPRSRPAQSCLMYRPRKGVCKRFPGLMSLLRIRFRACHVVQFVRLQCFEDDDFNHIFWSFQVSTRYHFPGNVSQNF